MKNTWKYLVVWLITWWVLGTGWSWALGQELQTQEVDPYSLVVLESPAGASWWPLTPPDLKYRSFVELKADDTRANLAVLVAPRAGTITVAAIDWDARQILRYVVIVKGNPDDPDEPDEPDVPEDEFDNLGRRVAALAGKLQVPSEAREIGRVYCDLSELMLTPGSWVRDPEDEEIYLTTHFDQLPRSAGWTAIAKLIIEDTKPRWQSLTREGRARYYEVVGEALR